MKTTAVIGPKGQIVIPANLRRRYGMKEGSTVVFQEDCGRLVLAPSKYQPIYALEGTLGEFPLEACLEEERQAERGREDR